MNRRSMRRRLVALLLLVVALGWLGAAAGTWLDAHRKIDALLDAHLTQATALVVAQAGHEATEFSIDDSEDDSPYRPKVVVQAWREGRELVFRSAGAPATRLSPSQSGFSDVRSDGRDWRVYSAWSHDRELLVQVAEDDAERRRITSAFARNALVPLGLVLPLLALLVGWVVRREMAPLETLGKEVARRGPQDMTALETAGLPQELLPLAMTLDRLFARIRDSLNSERRFTSQAAHELRTPIAAIRAQAEVALAAGDTAEGRAALHRAIEACDRASHLAGQLLVLARADETDADSLLADCRLDRVASRVLAAIAPAAMQRGRTVELHSPPEVPVTGNDPLLEALVRNLVDNAVRHGGRHCIVTIRPASPAGGPILEVVDDGPGIPQAEYALLGERFRRGSTATEDGSGLGLSIVSRIATLHRAKLSFGPGPDGRGFMIRVEFPRQAPQSG